MANSKYGREHDATHSWNGYNHQGKVALFVALQTINKLIESKSADINNYFLEIEWVEDFSIGQNLGTHNAYHSIHQVKAIDKSTMAAYSDALFGLVEHVRKRTSIEYAYLHVRKPVNLGSSDWDTSLETLIASGSYLHRELVEVERYISNEIERDQLVKKIAKPGRPTGFIAELKKYSSVPKIIESTIDQALLEYKYNLEMRLCGLKGIGKTELDKIKLFTYSESPKKDYCELEDIKHLLKEQINKYLLLTEPKGWKAQDPNFIEKMYLYLLGKLDQHLVDRHKSYSNTPERKISFASIVEWLNSEEFLKFGDTFYLYYLKESLFDLSNELCERCSVKPDKCESCHVLSCMDKLGQLSFDELNKFLRATNPHVGGQMNIGTFANFFQRLGYIDPFFKCLRSIEEYYLDEKAPVSYATPEKNLLLLTTLLNDGGNDSKEYHCSQIVKNREIYKILMDYDLIISKDIVSESIFADAGDYLRDFRYRHNEHHIAHFKEVKIKPLDHCIMLLKSGNPE